MENFLSNFANVSKEVTSDNANVSIDPEFYGTIDITKGLLKMTIHFWAKLYKLQYENCVAINDWDINDVRNVSFGGLPVDDINKLKQTMRESGLGTVAEGLEISNEDNRKEIAKQIPQSKIFKLVYGDDVKMFELLSDEEVAKIRLKFAIDNYDKMKPTSHEIKDIVKINEHGYAIMPTLDELKAML
jgi:hypothetical protein